MDDKSLKIEKCPKCNSEEVYTDTIYTKSSERMILPVSGFTRIYFDIYVCINCGYFEEYVADKDLKDEKKIDKIKKNWKRMQ